MYASMKCYNELISCVLQIYYVCYITQLLYLLQRTYIMYASMKCYNELISGPLFRTRIFYRGLILPALEDKLVLSATYATDI